MNTSKSQIMARLQREILPLQGYKPIADHDDFDGGLGSIKNAFPNHSFPLGAVHEFHCNGIEDVSATGGFISGIVSSIMSGGGAALWICSSRLIFPPALSYFGIDPSRMIFLESSNEKERLWAIEEALKCEGLAAVIGEIPDVSFTASRRLQLAVEQSRVTGFLIRSQPKNLATASVTRWKITPLPSFSDEGLPGVGHPKWNVALVKVRNGTPGQWQLYWQMSQFRHLYKTASIYQHVQSKTG